MWLTRPRIALRLMTALVLGAASPGCADEYYKGKTVTAYVGYTPGGANDLITRAIAQFIGRHMSGNPQTLTRNMPGAVTRTVTSYIYSVAAKDGAEFANIDRQITTAALLDPSIKEPFDILKMTWLGSPIQEALTCITWHTAPVQSLADLQSREFLVASPGGNSGQSITERILNRMAGGRLRSVHGYPGAAEMNLAMERGEVHGRCGMGWESTKAGMADWLKAGKVKALIQLSGEKNPELAGAPRLADLPMSEADRQAIALIYASQQLGQPFAAPPDMPAERKQALRKAFSDTLADPDFIAQMRKLNFNMSPLSGEDIERILRAAYNAPKDVLARAIALSQN